MAIEITRDLAVLIRVPLSTSDQRAIDFANTHEAWIEKAIIKQQNRNLTALSEPTKEEFAALKADALKYLPSRTKYFSDILGLYPTSVKITSAKSRFGSCNGKNGICFSCFLMRYPKDAIDYVIVHELCHIKHHNHSKRFWALVEHYMPDYKERKKLLR